jgi:hypothetical protein
MNQLSRNVQEDRTVTTEMAQSGENESAKAKTTQISSYE